MHVSRPVVGAVGAAMLLTALQAAAAQAPLRSTSERPLYPAQSLALAGVRLGMKPTEAGAALRASGYSRRSQTQGPGWDARISYLLLVNRSLKIPGGGQIVGTEHYIRGEEAIEVEYIPTPRGAEVGRVRYRIGFQAIEASRFQAAVIAKYGRPTRPSDSQMMYCSVGEVACTPLGYPVATQEPNILADVPLRNITLNMGARAWKDYEASLKAEMDRRAPQLKRPSL